MGYEPAEEGMTEANVEPRVDNLIRTINDLRIAAEKDEETRVILRKARAELAGSLAEARKTTEAPSPAR